MPWRGPSLDRPWPTLGDVVGQWIEAFCVVPDGDRMGEPFVLTDEQFDFLCHHYRLRPEASTDRPASAWAFRRSQLVRPQKWGKGPLTAAMICAEAVGPVLFDGWDADGEPVGRPWATPWIQVAAYNEDQTDNVWRALVPMIEESADLGALIPDTGETRINVPGRGLIEPVTTSGGARLGQRITFAVQDETHSWLKTRDGLKLADTQKRNLTGTGGRAVETTNAWNPAEMSVAQQTFESRAKDVHRDFPQPPAGSFANKRERRKVLKAVYGDSVRERGGWIDLDRLDGEIVELLERDPVQAERFFGNRIVATADAWITRQEWAKGHVPQDVPDGSAIVIGFDGSRYEDSTVLRCETVADGYGFTPTFADGSPMLWEKPDGVAGEGWEVPGPEVDAAIHELFDRFDVRMMYADPPWWQSEIDAWAMEWPGRVARWETRRDTQMAAALDRFKVDLFTGAYTHDGCPVTAEHVANARKTQRRGGTCITKDRPGSVRKIDAAVTAALAHEARFDALSSQPVPSGAARFF